MKLTATNGRFLVTKADLSYAANSKGIIRYSKVKAADKKAICEAPNEAVADFIQRAIDNPISFHICSSDLHTVLESVASQAAQSRTQCIEAQRAGSVIFPDAYTHVYNTNTGRYAITTEMIDKQLLCDNLITLNEKALSESDLANICFLTDYPTAISISNATDGIHAAQNTSDQSHAFCGAAIQGENGIMLRDGKNYYSLPSILQRGESDKCLRGRLHICIMQNWICSLYLSMAATA